VHRAHCHEPNKEVGGLIRRGNSCSLTSIFGNIILVKGKTYKFSFTGALRDQDECRNGVRIVHIREFSI